MDRILSRLFVFLTLAAAFLLRVGGNWTKVFTDQGVRFMANDPWHHVRQIHQLVGSEAIQQRLRELLRMNLDNAVERSDAFRAVPLPATMMRPLVRGVGQVILEATLDSVVATLESDEGREATRELVASILEQVLSGPLRTEIDSLSKSISIEVIDEMKDAVSVKKWAKADDDSSD